MCDSKTLLQSSSSSSVKNSNNNASSNAAAAAADANELIAVVNALNMEQSFDARSISSELCNDATDTQLLHQKTQSLLLASSMMLGGGAAGDGLHGRGHFERNNSSCSYNAVNLFGSIESMETGMGDVTPTPMPSMNMIRVNVDELLRENHALREKLKAVSADRDRLLCEVSNLRLELDMSELKRLPEESFPPKSIERSGSTQYGIAAAQGSASSASSLSNDGGYIYLQQHYAPSTVSTNSSTTINYPMGTQPHMVYQHLPQQYPTCHQQQQLIHQPNIVTAGGMHYAQHVDPHQHQHPHHAHHMMHAGHNHNHHHHHHGGAVVIAGSSVGTGMGTGNISPSAMQQNLHKKNSIRNGGEVLKRSRLPAAYELSQDLFDKQIELLERKYGGVCARNAATTIQRAFRHYMMVKKFASITAMAKAEKRLSRRVMVTSGNDDGPVSNSSMSSAYGSATESQLEMMSTPTQAAQQQQPRVTIMAGPPGGGTTAAGANATAYATTALSRTPPTRSLSMRERRHLDGSPIPRSQSGASTPSIASSSTSSSTIGSATSAAAHPHVNLLHAAEPHYYSMHHMPNAQGTQYYTSYHAVPHDASFISSSSGSQLDSSLNSSWVSVTGTSPHTPYYSASQIYMRPKGSLTPAERKKVPPEVPKRTSSITAQQQAAQQAAAHHQQMLMLRQTPPPASMLRSNGLCKTAENGSLTSVQSSGSDSSVTSAERIANSDLGSDRSNSPNTWKRGTNLNSSQQFTHSNDASAFAHAQVSGAVINVMPGGSSGAISISVPPADDHAASSHTSAAQYEEQQEQQEHSNLNNSAASVQNFKISETIRKRQYRVGLNLFNKKPEKGITYLIRRGFLENTPQGVARFLTSRKGLSRQMIGEYLGNLQNQFNMAVLNCFALELDLSGKHVDEALRKFQSYFRMPGEAQKIERLMEVFSQRFCQCNQDIVRRLRSSDTIFVLAFAIIMLNTDLHTPNLKPERRMRLDDFIKNLRGIDDCHDIEKDILAGIYDRVKADEFKPGSDHVTQVMKVQATIVGKKPNLALPHRRLVCYCRLYEIPDVNKKERPGVHQREVFLFNDLLVITKIFSKKKSSVTYTFRNSFPLCGMVVTLLDTPNYPFCIQLSQKVDAKILINFNARNEHDRCKFAEDLKESVSEMDEMEALRIEAELERQKSARNRATGSSENRDSGVADVEVCPCPYQATQAGESAAGTADSAQQLKRSALSNSLLDMHEQFGNEKPQRRGSVGSLDSGMSISFQSTTTSSASRENAAVIAAAANAAAAKMRYVLPNSVSTSMVGGVYAMPGYHQANLVHQSHAVLMQQQQQFAQQQLQQQQMHISQQQLAAAATNSTAAAHSSGAPAPLTGRIPGRERKQSRSDENGRSTEV